MERTSTFLRMAICLILASISIKTDFVDGSVVPPKVDKRSAAPERLPEDYSDFDLKYDDYPLIVPRKRAALLVDRLMVALQKAIEDEEQSRELESALGRSKAYGIRPEDAVRSMDLQRRGHETGSAQKGRVYWRCYFNAVTCF